MAAHNRDVELGPDDVYDLVPPPVLGGSDVANITAADFVVAVNIAGQLRARMRSLPPGTSISRVTADHGELPQTSSAFAHRRGRWRRSH